jgi:hypothetical protein
MSTSPSRRIDLHDVTAPAHERYRRPEDGRTEDRPAGARPGGAGRSHALAGPVGNLTFLAGVWLVISGLWLNYRVTGYFDASWSDVVVGIALCAVALVSIVKPAGTESLALTSTVLGAWLVAAPFVLDFSNSPKARWNDIVVGVVVLALSLGGVARAAWRDAAGGSADPAG